MISPELSRRLAAAIQTVPLTVRTRVTSIVNHTEDDAETLAALRADVVTATIFTTGGQR